MSFVSNISKIVTYTSSPEAMTSMVCLFMQSRAGTSPSVWTRGLAFLGLAGTRGLASPIEDLLSFKISPSLSKSDK